MRAIAGPTRGRRLSSARNCRSRASAPGGPVKPTDLARRGSGRGLSLRAQLLPRGGPARRCARAPRCALGGCGAGGRLQRLQDVFRARESRIHAGNGALDVSQRIGTTGEPRHAPPRRFSPTRMTANAIYHAQAVLTSLDSARPHAEAAMRRQRNDRSHRCAALHVMRYLREYLPDQCVRQDRWNSCHCAPG